MHCGVLELQIRLEAHLRRNDCMGGDRRERRGMTCSGGLFGLLKSRSTLSYKTWLRICHVINADE